MVLGCLFGWILESFLLICWFLFRSRTRPCISSKTFVFTRNFNKKGMVFDICLALFRYLFWHRFLICFGIAFSSKFGHIRSKSVKKALQAEYPDWLRVSRNRPFLILCFWWGSPFGALSMPLVAFWLHFGRFGFHFGCFCVLWVFWRIQAGPFGFTLTL